MCATKTKARIGYSRKVGTLLPQSAKKVFRKYGFAEMTLIRQWSDIAGPGMAKSTLPLKITYGREKGERIGILHLLVEPAAALQVQHQIPVLIEKIKIFYGHQPIERITLIQGLKPTARTREGDQKSAPNPEAARTMETWTKTMKDMGLKTSLIRLGEQILIRE